MIHHEITQNRANKAMDATAQVVVGVYDLSVEEEVVVHMVDKKYDTLRLKLLEEVRDAALEVDRCSSKVFALAHLTDCHACTSLIVMLVLVFLSDGEMNLCAFFSAH